MSEVQIHIGGRTFTVACQPGEEKFLIGAAKMLDAEASSLVDQLGKMPEAQMLLMSGLMLADKTAALEEQLRAEGIVMPTDYHGVEDRLAALAARAEAIADKLGG